MPATVIIITTIAISIVSSVTSAAITSIDSTGVNYLSNRFGIGTTAPAAGLDVAMTGTASSAIIVPRDSATNRPSVPINGMLRYNTSANIFEGYVNGGWTSLTGGGGGGAPSCPSGYTAYTVKGVAFCINTTSYDNASGISIGSGSTSNVGTLMSNCASTSGYVCSFAQLYSANAAGLIQLGNVGGAGGTYNGSGAITSETLFYPDAMNYNQNSNYCPQISGAGALTSFACSQARSMFCCR